MLLILTVGIVSFGVGILFKSASLFQKKKTASYFTGENEFKSFIATSMDAVIIADENQTILCFNNASELIFGYKAEDVIGKKISTLVPDNVKHNHDLFVKKFGEGGFSSRKMGKNMFVRGRHADGRELILEISISVYFYKQKRYYAGIIREFTERYKIESELNRLSVAVEQSSASIIITDSKGTIEYVNKGFTETTGYTLEEARGQNPRILKSGLTPPETFVDLWKNLQEGKRWSGMFINKKKNGEIYWQQATLSPILNKSGELTNYVGVIEDISHRKLKEELLRANEQRYRAFFEDDVSGAYIARADGTIIVRNKAFNRIFGLEKFQETETPLTLQSFYGDLEQWNATLVRLKSEHKLDNIREKLQTLNGNSVHVVENLVGTFDEKGELIEIAGYLINETRLKALEHQLLQSQKMESLGTLAAGVAHDFNNVLAIILNSSEVLRLEVKSDENLLKFIDVIADSAKRGSVIAKEMLLFSRHDVITSVPISLNKAIVQILNFLKHTLPKTIAIELQKPEQQEFEILGDYALIEQVYLNFSINAADAMPKGGKLILGIRLSETEMLKRKFSNVQDKEYVELYFSDTGSGMEQAMLDRIFDPFFTTKAKEKGTGLGLSIVHGIVTSMNGFIDVESVLGKGTTFRVYLPLTKEKSITVTEKEIFIPTDHDETVFIVDDEQQILNLMSEALSLYGYKTITSREVDDAIKKFKEHADEISVVLTDLAMPHKSGEELVRMVKSSYPDKKIIVMTGFNDPDISTKLKNIGADVLLQKPTEIDVLLETLERLLKPENVIS